MNANELADALFTVENYYTEPQDEVLISHVATMLRTIPALQAEIDDLKAKLQLHEAMDNQCASLMQQFRKASEK